MTAVQEREGRTALRLAAVALGDTPLTTDAYRSWRAGQVTPWPSATDICATLGPWREAVRHAGGTPPPAIEVLELGDRPGGPPPPPTRPAPPTSRRRRPTRAATAR